MMHTLTFILAALFVRQSAAADWHHRKAETTITTTGSEGSTTTITSSFSGVITSTGSLGEPILTFATALPVVTVVPFTTTVTPTFGAASGSGVPITANFTATVGVPFQGVFTFGGNASSITPLTTVTSSFPITTSDGSTGFSTITTTVPVTSPTTSPTSS